MVRNNPENSSKVTYTQSSTHTTLPHLATIDLGPLGSHLGLDTLCATSPTDQKREREEGTRPGAGRRVASTWQRRAKASFPPSCIAFSTTPHPHRENRGGASLMPLSTVSPSPAVKKTMAACPHSLLSCSRFLFFCVPQPTLDAVSVPSNFVSFHAAVKWKRDRTLRCSRARTRRRRHGVVDVPAAMDLRKPNPRATRIASSSSSKALIFPADDQVNLEITSVFLNSGRRVPLANRLSPVSHCLIPRIHTIPVTSLTLWTHMHARSWNSLGRHRQPEGVCRRWAILFTAAAIHTFPRLVQVLVSTLESL